MVVSNDVYQNIKYILYFLKFIKASLGTIFIVYGIQWIVFEYHHQKMAHCEHVLIGGFLVFLGMGAIIYTIVGTSSLFNGSKRLTELTMKFLVFLIIFNFDFGVLILSIGGSGSKYLNRLRREVRSMFHDPERNNTYFFDYVQRQLKCCGLDGYEDYDLYKKSTPVNGYPPSCCQQLESPCNPPTYKRGCDLEIHKYRSTKFVMSGSVCMAFVTLGFIAVLLLYLYKNQKWTLLSLAAPEVQEIYEDDEPTDYSYKLRPTLKKNKEIFKRISTISSLMSKTSITGEGNASSDSSENDGKNKKMRRKSEGKQDQFFSGSENSVESDIKLTRKYRKNKKSKKTDKAPKTAERHDGDEADTEDNIDN